VPVPARRRRERARPAPVPSIGRHAPLDVISPSERATSGARLLVVTVLVGVVLAIVIAAALGLAGLALSRAVG
jgi:hypothetical protein